MSFTASTLTRVRQRRTVNLLSSLGRIPLLPHGAPSTLQALRPRHVAGVRPNDCREESIGITSSACNGASSGRPAGQQVERWWEKRSKAGGRVFFGS